MNPCVIMPAHNEEKTIGLLVKQIKDDYAFCVLVIDDGSTDNTSQLAQGAGALVLRNQVNQGKGASLILGFNYVLNNNFDAVISMDADGQHLSEDIQSFINFAQNSSCQVLVGNRMLQTRNMPLIRILTNKIMSQLVSFIAHQNIPDTQCGFRLIRKEVLREIKLDTCRYETESELLVKAARRGFKIDSVPIKTVYSKEISHINPFIDTVRFFKFIFGYLWTQNH